MLAHVMPCTLSAICLVKCKLGFIRENNTSPKSQMPFEGEHLPAQIRYNNKLQSGQDPVEDDEHTDELHRDGPLSLCRNSSPGSECLRHRFKPIILIIWSPKSFTSTCEFLRFLGTSILMTSRNFLLLTVPFYVSVFVTLQHLRVPDRDHLIQWQGQRVPRR